MLQGKSWIHFQGGKWNETPTDQGKSLLLVQRHKKKTPLSLSLCVYFLRPVTFCAGMMARMLAVNNTREPRATSSGKSLFARTLNPVRKLSHLFLYFFLFFLPCVCKTWWYGHWTGREKKKRFQDFWESVTPVLRSNFWPSYYSDCVYMREADLRSDSSVNRVEKIHPSIFG